MAPSSSLKPRRLNRPPPVSVVAIYGRQAAAPDRALVIKHDGNEDHAIGRLLHDAAEDQGGAETLEDIRRRFGDAVAEIVSDCTDAWTVPKPEWRPRKGSLPPQVAAKGYPILARLVCRQGLQFRGYFV
jgi:HD domain